MERDADTSDSGDWADSGRGEASFPNENPNRPREYHGARTVVVALLVLGLPTC